MDILRFGHFAVIRTLRAGFTKLKGGNFMALFRGDIWLPMP